MSLSRKDYRAIAADISNLKDKSITCVDLIELLCRIFEADNPAFDKDKFREACINKEK